jgi:glucose-6-phosphate isomerase
VVKTVTSFRDGIGDWWGKNHVDICSTAAKGGLFVGSVGLLHLMKADSGVALAIGGSLIGGETVVKALKALPRKLFDVVHK